MCDEICVKKCECLFNAVVGDLEAYRNGEMVQCPECGEKYNILFNPLGCPDCGFDEFGVMSLDDWVDDRYLDFGIEYECLHRFSNEVVFRNAVLTVCLGGPTCTVDVAKGQILVTWGDIRETETLSEEIQEELWKICEKRLKNGI